MTLNRVKPGPAVTFMLYLASVVTLIFLPKILIWYKVKFPTLNLLKFGGVIEHELSNIPFSK